MADLENDDKLGVVPPHGVTDALGEISLPNARLLSAQESAVDALALIYAAEPTSDWELCADGKTYMLRATSVTNSKDFVTLVEPLGPAYRYRIFREQHVD